MLRFLPRRRGLFWRQCERVGVQSLGVILFAGAFLGAVLGYQLYSSLVLFRGEQLLGSIVGIALLRELAPVIGAIVVTGRVGSAMAAEIASMSVSEQLDAMEVMAVNPVEYLVLPRVLASLLMMPLLSFCLAWIGTAAAAFLSSTVLGLDAAIYWYRYWRVLSWVDWMHCFVKSLVFGAVFSWIGCFCGLRASGGAQAVGQAAQTTVVSSFLAILCLDYFLTAFLPFGFKKLVLTP